MTDGLVELVRQALLGGLVVAAPVLVAGFVVGTLAGLLQAATGVHEQVVGLVPRLAVMAFVLLATLPWMVERLAELFRVTAAP
ncbi:MAG: flagellar biosynthetic protein FliQ [Planctomycetaceae bacterium]